MATVYLARDLKHKRPVALKVLQAEYAAPLAWHGSKRCTGSGPAVCVPRTRAGLSGRYDEAVADGERAVALVPIARDAILGPYIQHQLVRISLLVGKPNKALDRLETWLPMPYQLSPGWLRIDPNFAPLRGHPRFERLLITRHGEMSCTSLSTGQGRSYT
jgi:hypothetical protein